MPAVTMAEMISKGKRKLTAKAGQMKDNYDAAKSRMKTTYGELPFNSRIKSAYNAGVDAGVYRAPDPERWGRNFEGKMG